MSIAAKIANAMKSGRLGQPVNVPTVHKVTIEFNDLIDDYSARLLEEMSFLLPRGADIPEGTHLRLVTYIRLLVKMRCCYVNGKPLKFLRPGDEAIVVPSFIHLLLSAIGKVEFKNEYLELIPKYDRMTDKDEENWDSLSDIRRLLVRMNDKFPIARGLPREILGTPDFMSLRLVDGILWHHRDDVEPTQALLASFMNVTTIESLWHNRVSYGHVAEYKRVIDALVEPRSKE